MASIGFNPNVPSHAGCGGATPGAPLPGPGKQPSGLMTGRPAMAAGSFGFDPAFAFGGAAAMDPAFAMAMPAAAFGDERFISSMAGGVIVGKDGAPAGRIPEGSFIDTRDGKLYGPDSKPLTLPEGATADFFDLPDIEQLMADARAGRAAMEAMRAGTTTTAPGTMVGGASGGGAPAKTEVAGQWGPGGVTDFKGGGPKVAGASGGGDASCDAGHGAPAAKGGGASGSTAVGGASGPFKAGGPAIKGGGADNLRSLTAQLEQGLASLTAMGVDPGGMRPGVLAGGPSTAVLGARGLGSPPSLQTSLMELVRTLEELARALQTTAVGGGGAPGPTTPPPGKVAADAPKVGGSSGSGSSSGSPAADKVDATPTRAGGASGSTVGAAVQGTNASTASTPSVDSSEATPSSTSSSPGT